MCSSWCYVIDCLFLAPKTLKAGDFQMQSILLENFRAAVEMMHAILQQVKPSIVGGFKEQVTFALQKNSAFSGIYFNYLFWLENSN